MSSASLRWLAPSCAADAPLVAFAAWLEGAGGWLAPSLQITCDSKSSGRGVVVRDRATLSAGDIAVRLPFSLLITESTARAVPNLGAAGLSSTNLIAAFLLEENTRWRPYVDALPRQIETTLRWTEAELAELQASDLRFHSLTRQRAVARHHASLKSLGVGLDEFGWALSVVWSRSHTLLLPDPPSEFRAGGPPRQQGALAPLLDLFNHAAAPSLGAATTDVENGVLEIRAARALGGGEACTVPYGAGVAGLPSARLLMDYGFCPAENAHDDVALPLGCDGAAARELLRRLRLDDAPPPRLGYPPRGGGAAAEPPMQALLVARACTLAPAAAEAALESEAATRAALLQMPAATLAADAAVRAFLAAAVARRLAEYATTADADAAALEATPPPPPRRRCALVVRLGEKRVLEAWGRALRGTGTAAPHDEL